MSETHVPRTPLPNSIVEQIDLELVEARLQDHTRGVRDRAPRLREKILSAMVEHFDVPKASAERDLDERLLGHPEPVAEMERILFEIEQVVRGGEKDILRDTLSRDCS